MRPHLEHAQIPPDDDDIVIHGTLSTLMDCIAAVVKVCVLLFLKMLLLPLLLGIWLDGATLSAFDKSVGERILFAGGDLFSFLLVHWVTGITFMLLVTVSVLQLREVIHPTLLARVIRPQEPQPDLLGNLLNESGPTHAKRMLLSFAIYAALLIVHVWLPAQLLSSCRVTSALPFLRPKFYHILSSQLQIPLELLIFHLTMLGFLEKYKNNIGAIQHSWLTFICHRFGLAQHLLPHSVAQFQLVGTKAIFVDHSKSNDQFLSEDDAATDRTPGLTGVTVVTTRSDGATTAASDLPITPTQSSASPPQWVSNPNAAENLRDMNQVDPFWYELAYKKDSEAEDFITQNMEKPPQLKLEAPKEKENGQCVVCNSKDYIRLPLPSSEQDVVDRKKRRSGGNARRRTSERKNVICTTQGTYRLRRAVRNDGVTVVEFWQECPGTLIVRPPEGWDDLREGSAEVQGRWAWGTEKRSKTEAGVACRKRFFGIDVAKSSTAVLLMRTVFLLLLSWLAIVLFVCIALSAPVWVGRSILTALRVSPDRIHDPLAFAIGVVIFGPTATAVVRKMNESAETPRVRIHKWMTKFNFPSTTKMFAFVASVVSWFVVFPLLSGILYELLFVKISADFGGESKMNLLDELSQFWRSGLVILHVWAIMCYLKAFTPQFWMDLGNAIVFVDDEEGRPNGEVRNPGDEGSWQGSCGKVGRLLTSFSRVVIGWEWDVIDSSQLKEVLLPILFNLSCAVLFPSFSYFCWRSARNVMGFSESGTLLPIAGEITEGLYRLVVYRILVLGSIMFQLALGFQSELQGWFEIVHKTARDDRYLTGQVLLNWSPEIGNTGGRRN